MILACRSWSQIRYQVWGVTVGLKAAKRIGIKKLKISGDSELVIRQIEGTYRVKNPSLAAYRATT